MPINKNAYLRYQIIDECLQCARPFTIDDLADACTKALSIGVSARTIQSDLKIMRETFKAPIPETGKYKNYTRKGFSIMKKTASYELLEDAYQSLSLLKDYAQFSNLSSLLLRIEDEFDIRKTNRKSLVMLETVTDYAGSHWLKKLYRYIANKQPVRITYQKFEAAESKEHIVSPYLLKEYRNRWFLYCSFENDSKVYNFAVDRMQLVEPAFDATFYDNHNFKPQSYFKDLIGVTKPQLDAQPITIQFWADPRWSNYIRTKPLHASQKRITTNDDGSQVFQIQVIENPELYSTLMYYGPGIKVLSPDNVKTTIQQKLRDAAQLYDS